MNTIRFINNTEKKLQSQINLIFHYFPNGLLRYQVHHCNLKLTYQMIFKEKEETLKLIAKKKQQQEEEEVAPKSRPRIL